MYTLSDYPVSFCYRFVKRCKEDCVNFTAYIPQTGELLQTDSLRDLLKILPAHLHYGVDDEYQENGCFIIADRWGNIYYWCFCKNTRFIMRCSVYDGHGNFEPDSYRYRVVVVR